jgi:hypothetical protein
VPDVIQPSQAVAWKSRPDVETTGAVRLLSSQSDYFGNIVSALTGWMQKAPIEPDHSPSSPIAIRAAGNATSLTVLVKSRHYAHFFKQEVSLDEGSAGV